MEDIGRIKQGDKKGLKPIARERGEDSRRENKEKIQVVTKIKVCGRNTMKGKNKRDLREKTKKNKFHLNKTKRSRNIAQYLKRDKKSRIRETMNLSTDADHRTDIYLGGGC